jgi:hypothetical protein
MAFKQFRKLYYRLVAGKGSIPLPSAKHAALMQLVDMLLSKGR